MIFPLPSGHQRCKLQKQASIDAEKYMTFQLGLMLYDLMVGDKTRKWYHDLSLSTINNLRFEDLNFDLPIFKDKQGQEIKEVIQKAMDPKWENRPTLSELAEQCKILYKSNISMPQSYISQLSRQG